MSMVHMNKTPSLSLPPPISPECELLLYCGPTHSLATLPFSPFLLAASSPFLSHLLLSSSLPRGDGGAQLEPQQISLILPEVELRAATNTLVSLQEGHIKLKSQAEVEEVKELVETLRISWTCTPSSPVNKELLNFDVEDHFPAMDLPIHEECKEMEDSDETAVNDETTVNDETAVKMLKEETEDTARTSRLKGSKSKEKECVGEDVLTQLLSREVEGAPSNYFKSQYEKFFKLADPTQDPYSMAGEARKKLETVCLLCDVSGAETRVRFSERSNHMRRYHLADETCAKCGQSLAPLLMKEHRKRCGEPPRVLPRLPCSVCGKVISQANILRHMKRQHGKGKGDAGQDS